MRQRPGTSDYILTTMLLDSQPEVSDLNFTIGKPLQVRIRRGDDARRVRPADHVGLTPFQTEMIALNLLGENQWHIEDLLPARFLRFRPTRSPSKARFRINIFFPTRQALFHRPAQATEHGYPHGAGRLERSASGRFAAKW